VVRKIKPMVIITMVGMVIHCVIPTEVFGGVPFAQFVADKNVMLIINY